MRYVFFNIKFYRKLKCVNKFPLLIPLKKNSIAFYLVMFYLFIIYFVVRMSLSILDILIWLLFFSLYRAASLLLGVEDSPSVCIYTYILHIVILALGAVKNVSSN